MGDHLGVAARAQLVAPLEQLLAQLAEVVDLAVEDDGDGAVLVGDRRVAGDQIDDCEVILRDRRCFRGAPGIRAAIDPGSELRFDVDARSPSSARRPRRSCTSVGCAPPARLLAIGLRVYLRALAPRQTVSGIRTPRDGLGLSIRYLRHRRLRGRRRGPARPSWSAWAARERRSCG